MEQENTKNKKDYKLIKIILILLVIILILGTAVFSAYLVKSNGNVMDAAIEIVTDVVGEQEPIFCLILGISDDISIELTDTIILAGYNPNAQKAFMVSIPRDTYIGKNKVNANGFDKINSLYQKDCSKTINAVEDLTGVKIDYYVAVKTNVLVEIVDAIGGVEFDVPIDMNYDDITQDLHIHLKSGLQHLNGAQAEQVVRFRHNNNGSTYPSSYGDNDYGRMRTQRDFIKALAKQVISFDNITNVKEITSVVFKNLKTDLTLANAFAYIPYGIKFNINDLKAEQLPGESKIINELWFYEPDIKKTKKLFDEMIESLELSNDYKLSHYQNGVNQNSNILNQNMDVKSNKNWTNNSSNNVTEKNNSVGFNKSVNTKDEEKNIYKNNTKR